MSMPLDISETDIEMLSVFRATYPTWWYTIGMCDVSSDFTAAPQERSPEAKYIVAGNDFDGGFACDSRVSLADAIWWVMDDIRLAIRIEENK